MLNLTEEEARGLAMLTGVLSQNRKKSKKPRAPSFEKALEGLEAHEKAL